MRNARRNLAIGLLGSLLLLVTGCGRTSNEEKFANEVCSDISDWQTQIKQATDDVKAKLRSPQAGTLAGIDADIRSAADATNTLASNLKSIKPPDSDEGTHAKQQLRAFSDKLSETTKAVTQTVASVPPDASAAEAAQKLAPLAAELQSLAVSASTTFATLQASGESLKNGFQKAGSCKSLR